jgi:hypothetical protein
MECNWGSSHGATANKRSTRIEKPRGCANNSLIRLSMTKRNSRQIFVVKMLSTISYRGLHRKDLCNTILSLVLHMFLI